MEDPIAALDQFERGVADFAAGSFAFYYNHVQAGFSEAQAMDLTRAWITALTLYQKGEMDG